MSDDGHKSGLHVHLGGLVIVIIIILILFKVDIKEKVQSPQFQKNIAYVEQLAKNAWDKYLKKPLTNGWNSMFNNLVDKGVEKIKEGGLLKIPTSLTDVNLGAPMNNVNQN
jgi:hypothetical protein